MNVTTEKLMHHIEESFFHSTDFFIEKSNWKDEEVIICYYSVLVKNDIIQEQLAMIQQRKLAQIKDWGDTSVSSLESFSMSAIREKVCSGYTIVIFPTEQKMLLLNLPTYPVRSPEEPENEHVIRGSHEGFVEGMDSNIALLRKRLQIPELVIKEKIVGKKSKTKINFVYIQGVAGQELIDEVSKRLDALNAEAITSAGQLEDYIEDNVWSPFPQYLNTERPDRVIANILEGRIAIFTDHTPTCLVGAVSFFSFYQSPDDFNGRVIVGSFYRLVRLVSFILSIFLPAFYIAVIGFHSEILPMDLSKQVKVAIDNIPYRPIVEAVILELFIELIREATIRLPSPVGQTIGIVGGLVIGDAIVRAGLVSNLMVIVVAMTAISSFVVPSVEMNTTIRVLRFPFMFMASLFGFFGMAIASLLLFIHLANLSSLKRPYLTPLIPFNLTGFKDIFLRLPYIKMHKQQKTFTFEQETEEQNK